MKKALLFAIASLFSAVAPALAYPPPAANVNFVSERGVPFDLVLDGRLVTRGGARQVHVDQLMPGQHWADFTVPAGYGRVVRFRSQLFLQPGLETSYVLIARPGRPLGLQQVGAVALYGPARGGYSNGYGPSYGGTYNSPQPYGQNGYGNAAPGPAYPSSPNGSYPSNNYPNTNPNGGYNAPNGNAPYGSGNGGYGNNPNGPAGGGYGNQPSSPGNGGYGNNPNNGGYGGYGNQPNNNGGGYPGTATSSYRALAPADMNALVQTMQQRITEVSKMNAAKDGLNQRALRADDLNRLLRSLSSEACRIDLAKFAYSHVSDPENFDRVYDAFETEAGAQAVEQAVREGEQR
ncbi:DUF4476 domain-containing protein [Hymenobacter convexus]|uniref:DUF4476 domain-containing protein n=1 Tax=Hymenobacter sp. CA1UV-4 TaxID=3063782 RepID=UPI002713FFF9|nr:DUF4476 domain-containing protein [Hymenobacter sp. CA1UV-4]MDO7850971.1 DUF4476 domain-containing protein [Hymenobacter sp. CA1UV-4]